MRVIVDVEANGLNPTEIWVIVCKNIDTGVVRIFRNVTQDTDTKEAFLSYSKDIVYWVGHNWLGYDYPVLSNLVGLNVPGVSSKSCDTLVVSKLVCYSRPGHSVEDYGLEFGEAKVLFNDFSKWSQPLEDRCVTDVEITHKIYLKYLAVIDDPAWKPAIHLEQRFQLIVNDLHNNGFAFNKAKAEGLLARVTKDLSEIDGQMAEAFPPREVLIREFTPKATKHGTISKSSVPRALHDNIINYKVGETYRHTRLEPFNPSSHKQLVQVLSEAGWSPTEKTQSHIDLEREINRSKYLNQFDTSLKDCHSKLEGLKKTGWKINENNLATLPSNAPAPARLLAKRILLEARRRTLTEWIELVRTDGRIHGRPYGIGTWTRRMAIQHPNMQNIPTGAKLYAKELRSFWCAPKNRLLIGVDADSIQFRVAAHYINDPSLIKKIVEGKKSDGSDPHSYNKKIIGDFCQTRNAAKQTLFSLILGGGDRKFGEIMKTSMDNGRLAKEILYQEYPGIRVLKEEIVVEDAKRGYFEAFDGAKVPIPGDTFGDRKHLCPSGYLQCGEAVIMKKASIIIDDLLAAEKALRNWFFVNIIHDELISEAKNDLAYCLEIAKIKDKAITQAGIEFKLRCPMAGSYYNEDIKDYTIGTDWYQTH